MGASVVQVKLARLLLCFILAITGSGWTHGTFSATCNNIVAVGDSLTEGTGPTPYPLLIATAISTTASNQGHAGAGWNVGATVGGVNLTARAATEVDPLRTNGSCQNPYLVLWAGTNDIFGGASTGAQTYSFFQTYIAARQSANWAASAKTIVVTMAPRENLNETARTAYNSALVSGASTYGYVLARVDQDANIGCAGCENNLTYFASDKVHLTQAGQNIVAHLVCTAMNLGGSFTCP